MIRVPRQNRETAVELLCEHDAHPQVRPGLGAKGDHLGAGLAQCGVESIWPADQQRENRDALIPQPRDLLGKGGAGHVVAALIEGAEPGAFAGDLLQSLRLCRPPCLGAGGFGDVSLATV